MPWKQGNLGGVTDANGNFIKDSALHEDIASGGYQPDKAESRTEDRTIIYLGMLISIYGHAITDNLKKLWFLQTDEGKKLISDGAELVYVTFWGQDIKPWVYNIFSAAGVDLRQAKCVVNPTCFSRVIVPENSIRMDEHGMRHADSAYGNVVRNILIQSMFTPPIRKLLSRQDILLPHTSSRRTRFWRTSHRTSLRKSRLSHSLPRDTQFSGASPYGFLL